MQHIDQTLAINIALGLAPTPAAPCDVRNNPDNPLVRQVTRVELKKIKAWRWLYVYWTPKPRTDGHPDCGYAGYREDNDKFNTLKLSTNNQPSDPARRLGEAQAKELK